MRDGEKSENSLVILQDGLCLGFIGLQSLDHRLWFVVLTLNQRFSCQVINALDRCRRMSAQPDSVFLSR